MLNNNSSIGQRLLLASMKRDNEKIIGYDKQLEENPRNEKALLGKCEILERLKRFPEAIECYEKLIGLDPKFKKYLLSKADSFYEKKDYDNAIKCFDIILTTCKTKSTIKKIWNRKGRALFAKNNLIDAINCYDKALEIDSEFIDASNNKNTALNALINEGYALLWKSKYEKAIEIFYRSLAITETSKAWTFIGNAFFYQDNYDAAIKCYDKAISIDPNIFLPMLKKAVALFCQKLIDQALNYFEKVLEKFPEWILALEGKAICFNYLGKLEEANNLNQQVDSLFRAIKTSPEVKAIFFCQCGDMFFSQENFKEAADMYKKAIYSSPTFIYPKVKLEKTEKLLEQQSDTIMDNLCNLMGGNSSVKQAQNIICSDSSFSKSPLNGLSHNLSNVCRNDNNETNDTESRAAKKNKPNEAQSDSVKLPESEYDTFTPDIDIDHINYFKLLKCFVDKNLNIAPSLENNYSLPPIPNLDTQFPLFVISKPPEMSKATKYKIGHWGEGLVFYTKKLYYEQKYKVEAKVDEKSFSIVTTNVHILTIWHNKGLSHTEDSKSPHDITIHKIKETSELTKKTTRYIEVKSSRSSTKTKAAISANQIYEMFLYGKNYKIARVLKTGKKDAYFYMIDNPAKQIFGTVTSVTEKVKGITITI